MPEQRVQLLRPRHASGQRYLMQVLGGWPASHLHDDFHRVRNEARAEIEGVAQHAVRQVDKLLQPVPYAVRNRNKSKACPAQFIRGHDAGTAAVSDGAHVQTLERLHAQECHEHVHHLLDAVDAYSADLLEEAVPDSIGSGQ